MAVEEISKPLAPLMVADLRALKVASGPPATAWLVGGKLGKKVESDGKMPRILVIEDDPEREAEAWL